MNTSRDSSRRRPRYRNNQTLPRQQEVEQVQLEQSAPRDGRSVPGRGRRGACSNVSAPSIPDSSSVAEPVVSHSTRENANRGGRSGRARGGRARGPAERFSQRIAVGGRQFGGRLTVEDGSTQEISELRADAPAFQPAQSFVQRRPPPPPPQPPREKKPRAPKSTAADIATRTHEDIDNGHYECAICTEDIRRHSRGIWSCRTCWTVFHIGCIKKWSTNEGSSAARQQAQDGDLPPSRQWRCPGCNLPKDTLPKNSFCWCEKELDPKALPGLPPFSCGQTCSQPRILPKRCPHPCASTCHAGPCPPCSLMGPTQHCFCGKKSITRRCIDTDYDNGWSCTDICGRLMPCKKHYCSRTCHDGPCGACQVRIPSECYCGQSHKNILCCDRAEEKISNQSHIAADGSTTVEEWTGSFQCPSRCGRLFDCGFHACELFCHRQDAEPAHCSRSPDVVSHCPCGKTPLNKMNIPERKSCLDPIPNCKKPCAQTLACGHQCQRLCHQGECPPCLQASPILCRCGRTESLSICHQGTIEAPHCIRVCRISLNCGRHECGERCCTGERKAVERQSIRRKARPLNSTARQPIESFEAEHICTRSCARQLKCGNPEHHCQELCHKGPCGSCRDAIFDELSCHCGRTILQPPLPCGTKPPTCRYKCERAKDCGHPQLDHTCHEDDQECPKCAYLTTKTCLCRRNVLKNQPCWFSEVRCGQVCGRTLRCGVHKCRKPCHRPGECEEPCTQACGKKLSICGHPCMATCHFPSLCKEDKLCQQKILVTCECQRIKQEAKCNASKHGEGNNQKVLKCDDECARLERNRKLAHALNVDPEHANDHVPYSDATLDMYQKASTWAAVQEKQLRFFAADPEERRLRFKPMSRNQRAFIHSLAEDFGFDAESMDPEPHRHVAIFKTPKFVMAPMRTLAECARTRQLQPRIAPAPAAPATWLRSKPNDTATDPYNAFVIVNPRFALTVEEVQAATKGVLTPTSASSDFEIHFLPGELVALMLPSAQPNVSEYDVQALLESTKDVLSRALSMQKIGKLQLARLDPSLNVLRKESDEGPGSGWSQVAASKSMPLRQVSKSVLFGKKGGFTVLSLNSVNKNNKKKKDSPVEVAEDWEAAEEEEEARERLSGANSSMSTDDEDPTSHLSSLHGKEEIEHSEEPKRQVALAAEPSLACWADLEDD